MTGASHPTVTRDARPARILRAAPQVMSLPRESMTVTATTSCRTRTPELCGPLTRRKTYTPGSLSRVAGPQKPLVRACLTSILRAAPFVS